MNKGEKRSFFRSRCADFNNHSSWILIIDFRPFVFLPGVFGPFMNNLMISCNEIEHIVSNWNKKINQMSQRDEFIF